MEYIGGKQLITEGLKSGYKFFKIYFKDRIDKDILDLARDKGVLVEHISKELEGKYEFSQGLLAEIESFNYSSIEELFDGDSGSNGVVLILDHLEDPHNLGAIIRTAVCSGVKGIIIPDDRSVRVNSTVLKTSSGAAFYIPIVKVKNINSSLSVLKENGYWIYGADMNGDTTLFKAKFDGLIGLVMGNEGKGISNIVRKSCDVIVSIPQVGEISSLNVSVASGVILYEIYRQRSINVKG